MKRNKSLKIKNWFLPVLAIVVFVLIQLLAKVPQFTEQVYSQGLYPYVASLISNFSRWFPFSLDDLFYLLLIFSFLLLIFLLVIRKISFKKAGRFFLNGISVVFVLFYLLWGFNYFRAALNARLGIQEQESNADDFLEVFENLVERTNKSYANFNDFNRSEIDSLVEESYKNLAPALKLKYPAGKRRAKNISFSMFFAKAGISGYFGPFFNEVHVNSKVLPVEYPFVLAHEKAHQFGITSEAEANFYAWLVCSQSKSQKLRYSGNLELLRYFINQGYRLDGISDAVKKLDENVKADYRKIREHWMSLRNEKVDKVATRVNDTYLKTNKIENGIEDYKGVVKYAMDFSLDSTFQKKWSLPAN